MVQAVVIVDLHEQLFDPPCAARSGEDLARRTSAELPIPVGPNRDL